MSIQTTNNIKQITKYIFLSLFFVLCSLFFVTTDISAASRYPIKELGSCKNASECYLYCQIPQNTPTCWSYNKYVLNKNVLGDSTVNISYPITELNNCASAKECYSFCSQVENRETCKKYGQEKGLIKPTRKTISNVTLEYARNELGCTDKESCKAFCTNPDNAEACHSFAQKHSLITASPSPAAEIINKAKDELGCSNYSQCVSYCNNEDNRDKCLKFAKDNNLISSDTFEREKILKEKMQELLDTSKEELACDSFTTCAKKCQDPANKDKCKDIAKEFSLSIPNKTEKTLTSPSPNPSGTLLNDNGQKACTNEKECREYCQKNPKDCPGYLLNPTVKPEISQTPKAGDYLGPGGCKTEAECREYCTKHPSVCPGFPKEKTTETKPTPSISKSPSPTPEFPPNCSLNAECKERYCKKYPKNCTTNQYPTPTKTAATNTTVRTAQTNEFPANCSQIEECRQRYCKKYGCPTPLSSPTKTSIEPTETVSNTGFVEVTATSKTNTSGNPTPIPLTEPN